MISSSEATAAARRIRGKGLSPQTWADVDLLAGFVLAGQDTERLREFARFIVTLDDPRAESLRRSISLTEIISRARAALAEGGV